MIGIRSCHPQISTAILAAILKIRSLTNLAVVYQGCANFFVSEEYILWLEIKRNLSSYRIWPNFFIFSQVNTARAWFSSFTFAILLLSGLLSAPASCLSGPKGYPPTQEPKRTPIFHLDRIEKHKKQHLLQNVRRTVLSHSRQGHYGSVVHNVEPGSPKNCTGSKNCPGSKFGLVLNLLKWPICYNITQKTLFHYSYRESSMLNALSGRCHILGLHFEAHRASLTGALTPTDHLRHLLGLKINVCGAFHFRQNDRQWSLSSAHRISRWHWCAMGSPTLRVYLRPWHVGEPHPSAASPHRIDAIDDDLHIYNAIQIENWIGFYCMFLFNLVLLLRPVVFYHWNTCRQCHHQ